MPDSARRLLVVRYGRIGDMLVVTPVLRALRAHDPTARIDVLTSRDGLTVLGDNPNVHRVHVLEWRRVPRLVNLPRARRVRELRAVRYDAIFLLESGEHHHALVRQLGVDDVFTFARAGEPIDRLHAARGRQHEIFNFFAVLERAGVPPAGEHYDFVPSSQSIAEADTLLRAVGIEPGDRVAGIHAGHFRRRTFKRTPHAKTWPADRWQQTGRGLLDAGFTRVILTGTAAERRLNAQILSGLPAGAAVDLAGRTRLPVLAAILRHCRVFIAPDTGPAHLAAAVGTPLVALFGPKPPGIMGPRGDDARIRRLFPEPSRASVAERHGHHPRMWAITSNDVLRAVAELAGEPTHRGASS